MCLWGQQAETLGSALPTPNFYHLNSVLHLGPSAKGDPVTGIGAEGGSQGHPSTKVLVGIWRKGDLME